MKQLTAATLLLVAATAAAQSTPWSLDSCIDYAVTHNITVMQREADVESGRIAADDARNGFLPQASAGASQSWSFGRGLTADNTYANRNTSSMGWSANISVPLTYALGSGQARVSQSRTYLTGLLHQLDAARDDVRLNVITRYLQALYSRDLLAVAQRQEEMSARQLSDRRELFDAGKISELDVTQAQSQLAQDKLSRVTAEGDLDAAMLDLMQLLNLPQEMRSGFDIEAVEGDTDSSTPLPAGVFANALEHNSSLLASRDNIEYARKGITVAKTAYIPSLSLSGGLGSNYYRMGGADNGSFGSQMRHNFSQNIGLSLNVPLFDAFSRRNGVRRARVSYLNAQLAYDAAAEQLYKTIDNAYTQAVNAGERFTAATEAARAAEAALEAVNQKYVYDRATPTDVEQAKNTYYAAESTAVRARYERLLRLRILEFYNEQAH